MPEPFIVTLSVEGMKHSITTAISEHLAKMDKDIQAVVDKVCTPEFVSNVIKEAASAAIARKIKDEVTNYYSYGDGAKTIAEVIKESLSMKTRLK